MRDPLVALWNPGEFVRFGRNLGTSTSVAEVVMDEWAAYLKAPNNPEGPHALARESHGKMEMEDDRNGDRDGGGAAFRAGRKDGATFERRREHRSRTRSTPWYERIATARLRETTLMYDEAMRL